MMDRRALLKRLGAAGLAIPAAMALEERLVLPRWKVHQGSFGRGGMSTLTLWAHLPRTEQGSFTVQTMFSDELVRRNPPLLAKYMGRAVEDAITDLFAREKPKWL